MKRTCPVCASKNTVLSVSRERLPLLQNRVYDSRAYAKSAKSGSFKLATCKDCGFSFNDAFDAGLMTYDETYNNDVPSSVFVQHMESVASKLIESFDLKAGGTVYDVGCGKGTFLKLLCEASPSTFGIGMDPSCKPFLGDNFEIIQDVFRPGSFRGDAKLVVLRHVLEHIVEPVAFLRELGECAPGVPLYVEVPDASWIVENGTFWDFCYEHCNYFTPQSLCAAMELAGFEVIDQAPTFGGQYQWIVGRFTGALRSTPRSEGLESAETMSQYALREQGLLEQAAEVLRDGAVVWGMATKGVIFSLMNDAAAILGGVDVNEKKQGKFAPLSGVEIHHPVWLQNVPDQTVVIIMNPNYAGEIKAAIADMGLNLKTVAL